MAEQMKKRNMITAKRFKLLLKSLAIGLVVLIIAEVFFATLGENEVYTNPDRTSRTFGSGTPALKYLVMGDSTAAGQGAPYEEGFAVKTSEYLAQRYTITMINTGVSGAKVDAVLADQIAVVSEFRPDVVVISMSANDTVRLTSLNRIQANTIEIIDEILKVNCNAKIVVTGSPDMGTILRFLPPLNWIATWHSKNVTDAMTPIIKEKGLTYAPIFEEVGPPFRKDTSLFSSDKYHPNARGYVVWTNVLNKSLDEALKQPSHCDK